MKKIHTGKCFLRLFVVCLAMTCILTSCDIDFIKNKIHTHSFVVQSSGILKCSGCDERIEQNYIAIVDGNNAVQKYSRLTASDSSIGLTVEGKNIGYTNTSGTAEKVVIYTISGQNLTINAPNDDITHFGEVESVNIIAVANNSYHGKASVEKTVSVAKGNIELEVSVPEVKVEATGSVSINLGQNAKVESLSLDTKQGTSVQTIKVGGTGTVNKLETTTPIKIETKVDAVEVKSTEVSITLSGNAEITEVKVDDSVQFTSEKKFEINITGNAKVEGVVGIESIALEIVFESGTFTVSSHGEKVSFAKGNLWYNTSTKTWNLEDSQLNYQTSWDANHVDKFYWSKSSSVAVAQTYSDSGRSASDKFFAAENFSVDGYDEWGTLSYHEWYYLLFTRSTNVTGVGRSNARFARVIVNGVKGLLLFPDTFEWNTSTMGSSPAYINDEYTNFSENWSRATSYTLSEFEEQEEAGIVFLPCAGCRYGSTFYDVGSYGDCWTSTPNSGSSGSANYVYFGCSDVNTNSIGRYYGRSVRLVTRLE